jgi:predicted MFS family arabinose efflux permease
MKKNLIIIILAIAFVTSFSWNWIGKAKASGDPVEDAAAAINTFVGNGGVCSGAAGGGGRLQISFVNAPNQAAAFLTVTIVNIDDEDIGYVVDP